MMGGSSPTVVMTYIGDLYEKRIYTDSTPTRVTIHLFANGQRIASVTKAGSTATAFNTANQWRGEMAMASLYNGRSVSGLSHKAFHLLKAAVMHPNAARWVLLALFGAFAAWILILVASPFLFRTGRFSYSSRIRLAAASILLIFAFTTCSDGGPGISAISMDQNYLLTGDTNNGPAVGTFFYHTNHINSSSVITDASGNEVSRMVYLPFGELSQTNSTGSDTVTHKFTSQEFDEDSGLYYYGARYYDPKIGRFLSADSMIPDIYNSQAFNRYSYVMNNPVMYTDPSGHAAIDPISEIINGGEGGGSGTPLGEIGKVMGQAIGEGGSSANVDTGCYQLPNGEYHCEIRYTYTPPGPTPQNSSVPSSYQNFGTPTQIGQTVNGYSLSQRFSTSAVGDFFDQALEHNSQIRSEINIALSGGNYLTLLALSVLDLANLAEVSLGFGMRGLAKLGEWSDSSGFTYMAPMLGTGIISMVGRAGKLGTAFNEGSQGFRSFSSFKRAMGAAGEGMQWHHFVEQTWGNILRFGPEAIHNTSNVINIDATLNQQLGSLFSSIRPGITGSMNLTVRSWLSTQFFEAQYQFGKLALENLTLGIWP